MDQDRARLILDLQTEDLTSLTSSRKGKGAEGSAPTDQELATDLQMAEFKRMEILLNDTAMARSISRAVQNNGPTIVRLAAGNVVQLKTVR